jgi:hypothetical protein
MPGKIDRITLSITVNSKIASSRDPFNTERTFIRVKSTLGCGGHLWR